MGKSQETGTIDSLMLRIDSSIPRLARKARSPDLQFEEAEAAYNITRSLIDESYLAVKNDPFNNPDVFWLYNNHPNAAKIRLTEDRDDGPEGMLLEQGLQRLYGFILKTLPLFTLLSSYEKRLGDACGYQPDGKDPYEKEKDLLDLAARLKGMLPKTKTEDSKYKDFLGNIANRLIPGHEGYPLSGEFNRTFLGRLFENRFDTVHREKEFLIILESVSNEGDWQSRYPRLFNEAQRLREYTAETLALMDLLGGRLDKNRLDAADSDGMREILVDVVLKLDMYMGVKK